MMNFLRSLRFRLLFLVLLASLPALALILYNSFDLRKQTRENVQESMLREVRLLAVNQRRQVDAVQQLMLGLSQSSLILAGASPECDSFLMGLVQEYPLNNGILAADLRGDVYCSSFPRTAPVNIADHDYFQTALAAQDFSEGEYIDFPLVQNSVLPLAYPLKSTDGQRVGAVIVLQGVTWLQGTAQTIDLPEQSALMIVDAGGLILDRYPDPEIFRGKLLEDAPLIQTILLTGGEGTVEVPGVDSVRRLYAFTPLNGPSGAIQAYVVAGIPSSLAYGDVDRSTWRNLLLLGLVMALSLVLVWFGSEVVLLRQISQLLDVTHRLGAGDLGARSPIPESDGEIGELSSSFNMMADRLEARETELNVFNARLERSNRDLQDFAYIASHDLQEPLRKIQAFGQLLEEAYADKFDEDGRAYLDRMRSGAARMQSMINDLLSYSRVVTRAQPFSRVDLHQVAREVIADLEPRIQETGGRVEVDRLPKIDAEPTQMHQLLLNLISNALKFHRPDVPPVVEISCLDGDVNGRRAFIRLVVKDNGIGFDQKYGAKIFIPFQRLHSKSVYEGSGIGLAIVSKIAVRHGGSVHAVGEPGQGSTFIVTLPVRQSNRERTLPKE